MKGLQSDETPLHSLGRLSTALRLDTGKAFNLSPHGLLFCHTTCCNLPSGQNHEATGFATPEIQDICLCSLLSLPVVYQ
jgi:hypothetical protein